MKALLVRVCAALARKLLCGGMHILQKMKAYEKPGQIRASRDEQRAGNWSAE